MTKIYKKTPRGLYDFVRPISMTTDQHNKIDEYCKRNNMTFPHLMRGLIDATLELDEKEREDVK